MSGLGWRDAATLGFALLWILAIARNVTLTAQRDDQATRAICAEVAANQATNELAQHLAGCGLATVHHLDDHRTPIGDAAHDAAVFEVVTRGLEDLNEHDETWGPA